MVLLLGLLTAAGLKAEVFVQGAFLDLSQILLWKPGLTALWVLAQRQDCT